MFEKTLLEQVLRRIKYGQIEVTYWDGAVGHFGTTGPKLKVTIKNQAIVRRLIANASLAVGEAYMNGQLVIEEGDLPTFFELVAKNQPKTKRRQPHLRALNHKVVQKDYIAHHYDVGNPYYKLFLDKTLMYSCAYFRNGEEDSLEQAQRQKIDLLLRKLDLKKGQTLLDIGCGWGHLAVAAAKQYGTKVLGITLSEEQLVGAKALARREGVSHLVKFQLKNYQDLSDKKQFDRIISVGMFEHVGKGNQTKYFAKVDRLLKEGGVSVLHTITQKDSRPTDSWVDKYIFPGGHLPTVAEISESLAQQELWQRAHEDLCWHYATTLKRWRDNHRANRQQIIEMFDEQFYRMRDFWLAGSEAGFRYGRLGLAQFIIDKRKPENMPPTVEDIYR